MKRKITKVFLCLFLILAFITGCGRNNNGVEENKSDHKKISAQEAKSMMESNEDMVIIDVREESEYNEGHIKNSLLLPLGKIEKDIEKVSEDKDKTILLYCRSGRRSSEAATILTSLGYRNVYDFGGIIDWDYEIVK